jgi:hypothetical protein
MWSVKEESAPVGKFVKFQNGASPTLLLVDGLEQVECFESYNQSKSRQEFGLRLRRVTRRYDQFPQSITFVSRTERDEAFDLIAEELGFDVA